MKVWAVGKPGMKLGLVGYPGGAGTAKKPIWKDFQDIVITSSARARASLSWNKSLLEC